MKQSIACIREDNTIKTQLHFMKTKKAKKNWWENLNNLKRQTDNTIIIQLPRSIALIQLI